MSERMIIEAHWGYHTYTLKSGDQAEKGKLACFDTASPGMVVKGRAATTLIPFGVFAETLLGDGNKPVQVKLFQEIQAIWWVNDATNPVVAAATLCFIKDDQTVSVLGTGRSVFGFVLALDPVKGVLVHSTLPTS